MAGSPFLARLLFPGPARRPWHRCRRPARPEIIVIVTVVIEVVKIVVKIIRELERAEASSRKRKRETAATERETAATECRKPEWGCARLVDQRECVLDPARARFFRVRLTPRASLSAVSRCLRAFSLPNWEALFSELDQTGPQVQRGGSRMLLQAQFESLFEQFR